MSLITGVTAMEEKEEALGAAGRSLDKSGSEQDPDSFAQLTSTQLSVSLDFIRVISLPEHIFK